MYETMNNIIRLLSYQNSTWNFFSLAESLGDFLLLGVWYRGAQSECFGLMMIDHQ